MGYDLSITSGRVRSESEGKLAADLSALACELELEWTAINMVLRGEIHHLRWVLKDGPSLGYSSPIEGRNWQSRPYGDGDVWTRLWVPAVCERIHGIIIHHPYEDWGVYWNVDHDLSLASYRISADQAPSPVRDTCDSQAEKKPALPWVASTMPIQKEEANAFFHGQAIDMQYNFWEDPVGLHTPWRQSDVRAAVDVLRLVEHCAEALEVRDEYGVWEKGMGAWRNLAGAWTSAIPGSRQAHPDAADDLMDDTDPSNQESEGA
ncbi:MAG: hypothetical protein KDL10_11680 [Kiritimatiellae bacterium]|nr:hypothetical protein [Kiritimatiellia bacterium]